MTAQEKICCALAGHRLAPLSFLKKAPFTPENGDLLKEADHGAARVLVLDAGTATLGLAEPCEEDGRRLVLQQASGESRLQRDSEICHLQTGDLMVLDLSLPFQLSAQNDRRYRLLWLAPDDRYGDLSSLTSLGASHISATEGVGAIAADCFTAFVDRCEQLDPQIFASLLWSLVSMLDSATLAAAGAEARCSKRRAYHVQRIKRFMLDNLRDPALCPSVIADSTGVSRRYLDDLFSEEGTSVTRFLWKHRLEGARRNLEDPRFDNRQITEIAFSWGFNSASHFSRSFSEYFAMSPSRYRTRSIENRPMQ